jgi:amidohydrolase
MTPHSDYAALVSDLLPEITAFRRDLHQHPEVSGSEQRTAALVAQRLQAAGIPVRTGVGGHGLVALIGEGSPCIGLRGDMDALPLQEQADVPWASQTPGVMHACGHDFHTAWLLGAGLALARHGLSRGSVKLLFQPAEESLGGAAGMIADGALQDPPVEAICGAHVMPDYVCGQVALMPGPNLAASDTFSITVTGRGTHGANPHLGRDPLPVAAEIVLALQTLVSRRLDPLEPAVVSVCQVHAGQAWNIIPQTVELGGTVRTLRAQTQDLLEEALGEVCRGIAAAHGCQAEVVYTRGVPSTITDPAVTTAVTRSLQTVLGEDRVILREQPNMGGEDFSYMLERVPGALLWVGCAPDAAATTQLALHNPHFCGDEDCLRVVMLAFGAIALDYLSSSD